MHAIEHDQVAGSKEPDAPERPVGSSGSNTTFHTAGTIPPVTDGFADPKPTASERGYGNDELGDARRYNLAHPQLVDAFNAATASSCVNEGGLDPKLVANWQRSRNLAADGKVGPMTLAAAEKAHAPAQNTQGQHDGGQVTHTDHAAHDAATSVATGGGASKDGGGATTGGGNHLVGGNTAHTGAVEEGMMIDGWRVFATTAKKGGTIAWKDNNPGNITLSHANDGGMFGDYKWSDGAYRVFPTFAAGRAAIAKYWRAWQQRRPGLTIEGMVMMYGDATSSARQTYRDLWTKATGAPETTKIEDLSDAQLEAITAVTVTQEGTVAGTELPRTDPRLPDGVFTGTR